MPHLLGTRVLGVAFWVVVTSNAIKEAIGNRVGFSMLKMELKHTKAMDGMREAFQNQVADNDGEIKMSTKEKLGLNELLLGAKHATIDSMLK